MTLEELNTIEIDDHFYTEITQSGYPETVTKVYAHNGQVYGVQFEHTWKNDYGLFRQKEYISKADLLEDDVILIKGDYSWGNRYIHKM